ncbi:putative zinc finger protein [Orchesella cincta]|uniref:Putative zinc finger protein n=1 Tax=Orchesella cincta TaxID=48709 RepID=A0A1D2MGZ3_ORCCI|nr:putative zinc finger protein [Orchesella cincta]
MHIFSVLNNFKSFKMSTEKNKNVLFLNTDGVCLLCYDDCPKSMEKEDSAMQTSINFCKLISRYLGFSIEKLVETPVKHLRKCEKPDKVGVELCERCFQLALAFCNVHFQLQFHQMVLDRCIRTISEIIKESEKTAKGALFTMCKDENSLMQQKKFTRLALGNLKSAHNLRNKLQQRCLVKLETAVPIVKLKDIFGNNPPMSKPKALSTKVELETLIPSLLGCVISFWIVLSLLFFNPDEPNFNQKEKKRKKIIPPPVVQSPAEVQTFGSQYSAQVQVIATGSMEVEPIKPNATTTISNDFPPLYVQPTNQIPNPYIPHSNASTSLQQPYPYPSTSSYPPYTNTWNSYNYNYSNNGYNYNYTNYNNVNNYQGSWSPYSAPANLGCSSSSSTYMAPPSTYNNDLSQQDDANSYIYDTARSDQSYNNVQQPHNYYTPPSTSQTTKEYHQLTTPQQQTGNSVVPPHSDAFQMPGAFMGESTYSSETTPMDMEVSTSSSSSEEPNLSHHTAVPDDSQLETEENHNNHSSLPSLSSKNIGILGPGLFPEIHGKQKGRRLQTNKCCIHHGCTETFVTKGQLELHLRSHGTFKCNHCHLTFGKAHTLALHEKQRHSPPGQPFSRLVHPCTRCDSTFTSQNKFFLHFFSDHLNISVYDKQCLVCKKQYVVGTTTQTIQAHYKNSHDVSGRDSSDIYTCADCKAPFLTSQQLKVHRTHRVCKQN